MHDEYSRTERARMAAQRWARGVRVTRDNVVLFSLLCAYGAAMSLSEQWLKFRAVISDRRGRIRVVPHRNGIVQLFTDLELIMRTGGSYGGKRAEFITDLARLEDELLVLREADAAMRREEAGRTANRRHEAVAATKEKLKVDTQDGCEQ